MGFYDEFEKYNEKFIVVDENGKRVKYAELSVFCDKIQKSIPNRTLVFSFCQNAVGSLFGYIGFLKNKIVPVLIDMNIDRELVKNLLEKYKPNYLYIPKKMQDDFKDTEVVFEEYNYLLVKTTYNEEHILNSELALLLTTSGSTGSPKLVRQSYKNIQSNAEAIAEYLEITSDERPITTLPMNYTYGLSIINSHALKGATILLTNKTLMEKEFWNFFKNEEATSFGGVPYTYEMLKRLRFFNMKLPSLKTITQAGGKLTVELTKEIAEYSLKNNIKFFVMYGQTEATARMSYLSSEYCLDKCGSIGVAIPGGRFSLIDGEGNEIKEAEVVGELVYEGDNVTLGYAESKEDLCKGNERQGRLVTGDMAKRDKDGFYYITGRKKRFIKIFGNRVNLDEIERLIKGNICTCACAGEDDHMNIFITDLAKALEVKEFITTKTGLNHIAFNIKVIDDIPKNEAGKVLYSKLNEVK